MAPITTYRNGHHVDAIDRNGVSIGLDSAPQLSSRSSPSPSVVSSTRPPHPPTDLRGQSPSSGSRVHEGPVDLQGQNLLDSARLTRAGDYLYGPRALLNIRSHPRARAHGSVEGSRPSSRGDGHAYTASKTIRPLQRARPLQEGYTGPSSSRPLSPSRGHTKTGSNTPSTPRPRKDSAASKFFRRTLNIKKTTEVKVTSEPASAYVKSSGSNVFVERGRYNDGELYAGVSKDRYKYSAKVWAEKGKWDLRKGVKRGVDEVICWVGKRGRRVRGVFERKGQKGGKEGKEGEIEEEDKEKSVEK